MMALTLSSSSVMGGQDSPIDLSRTRSSSPRLGISVNANLMVDRGVPRHAPPTSQHDLSRSRQVSQQRKSQQLRVSAGDQERRARAKRRRLEETVDMLRVQHAESAEELEDQSDQVENGDDKENYEESGTVSAPQLLQHLLLLQQKEYSPLLYLQYCALLQRLQLQQALRNRQCSSSSSPPVSPEQLQLSSSVYDDQQREQLLPMKSTDHADQVSSPSSSPSIASSSSTAGGATTGAATPGSRRRAPRTLTGKHVRQGHGASPETLRTLKALVLERSRMRALGLLPAPSARGKRASKKSVNKKAK